LLHAAIALVIFFREFSVLLQVNFLAVTLTIKFTMYII
jgi:hypothetical protein